MNAAPTVSKPPSTERAVLTSREKLRGLMTYRQISVRGLADAAGIKHHSMIQQLRDGSRTGCRLRTAEAIALALMVDPTDLFLLEHS